jgi:hypothetical protein
MLKITCTKCKQEVTVPLYFYDINIITEGESLDFTKTYIASAVGKAICPCCGDEIYEHCRNPIYNDDIVALATRRYSNG